MRPPYSAAAILLLTVLPCGRTAAQQPARFLLQAGPTLTMPLGDFAAVEPHTGGFATSEFGISLRCCAALTGRISVYLSWTRYTFGFDTTMYEEYVGEEVWDARQHATTLAAGARFYVPTIKEHMPYVQASVGRYTYELEGIRDYTPLGRAYDPVPGFSFGGGTILPLGSVFLELSLDLHTAPFTFVDGDERDAAWLAFTLHLTLPTG